MSPSRSVRFVPGTITGDELPSVSRISSKRPVYSRAVWLISLFNECLLNGFAKFCRIDLFAAFERPKHFRHDARALQTLQEFQESLWQASGGQSRLSRRYSISFNLDLAEASHARELFENVQELRSKRNGRGIAHWPKFVFLIYTIILLHIFLLLYYQYLLDINLFRLRRHRWSQAVRNQSLSEQPDSIKQLLAKSILKSTLSELEQSGQQGDLLDKVLYYKNLLRMLGSSHKHLHFAIQTVYIIFVGTTLISYLASQYFYRFRVPFDFYSLRVLLDLEHEHEFKKTLIYRQVNLFLLSSRNFSRFKFQVTRNLLSSPSEDNTANRLNRRQSMIASLAESDDNQEQASQSSLSLRAEEETSEQLHMFVSQGQLLPPNLQPIWVRRHTKLYFFITFLSIVYAIFMDVSVGYVIYYFRSAKPGSGERLSWGLVEKISMLEACLVLLIANITTIFYITTLLVTCIDQILLSKRLKSALEHCVALNGSLNEQAKQIKYRSVQIGKRDSNLYNDRAAHHAAAALKNLELRQTSIQMNSNLLLMLMHYRIFAAQLRPLVHSFRAISLGALIIFFFFPLVCRPHLPYVDPSVSKQVRLSLLYLNMLIILPMDLCLIPVCMMHARCLDLYKSLYRLLGHAIRVQGDHLLGLYDKHTVSMLRKELDEPNQSAAQFATSVAQISFTFPNLVRFHFYFGFILLSFVVDPHFDSTDLLFNDPFGLF